MDTDQYIQKLVRTYQEGSECTQHKIEETIQYWVAQEKKAVMNYHRMLELNNTVSNKRVQQLYSQDQPQEVIDQAEPPEEYSGSSDLEVYETFVAGILQWLKLHGLLAVKYTETQVQFLGMQLKGNASEWFTRNVECPNRPIRDWSLESVIEGSQKRLLNLLTHRQVSNKFDTIEQGQKTVQELIQEVTKYAA